MKLETRSETGTLAELNVNPGDVVDWIDIPNCRGMSVIEANALYEHPFVGMIQAEFSNYGRGIFDKEKFRIISRASTTPSPVRTVTRITTHGTWSPRGKMPKTQYVYEVEFDLDENGHPDWKTATVRGK